MNMDLNLESYVKFMPSLNDIWVFTEPLQASYIPVSSIKAIRRDSGKPPNINAMICNMIHKLP